MLTTLRRKSAESLARRRGAKCLHEAMNPLGVGFFTHPESLRQH
jgi:hypothetical protein